ncbi:hypothetical protein ONZ45_g9450 [Pleurotus djamor]|nr:hypothetical protein ONZ45_g9450 [Pleurotus djamor]
MLVVDLLHEVELGVWKHVFTHLIRLLYASPNGQTQVDELDQRFRCMPTFGKTTIRKFATNTSDMKKLAARDFEDILQCSIPAFSGLLDGPHDTRLQKLLYRLGEWHALAKLRMHTDSSLKHFERLTTELGRLMRDFERTTCTQFNTVELPREVNARVRRQAAGAAAPAQARTTQASASAARKSKKLNLNIYKYHALGDYAATIREYGTTDSYSTQMGEQAHRRVKAFYKVTPKRNAAKQIARRHRRERILRRKDLADDINWVFHHFFMWTRDVPLIQRRKTSCRSSRNVLARMDGRDFDADMDLPYTASDRNSIQLVDNTIFSVKTCRINYTTYDVRRDYDIINPRTQHRDVMVYAPTGDPQTYWYARVLGIFHTQVVRLDTPHERPLKMEFLWVRWFGTIPGHRFGSQLAKLPKIGFVPELEDEENYAFGFLDPALVIRSCHIIPDFEEGTTSALLPTQLATAARHLDEKEDWYYYYVNIFADRDLFMRHRGGGIGHTSLRHTHLASGVVEEPPITQEAEEEEEAEEAALVAAAEAALVEAAEEAVLNGRDPNNDENHGSDSSDSGSGMESDDPDTEGEPRGTLGSG